MRFKLTTVRAVYHTGHNLASMVPIFLEISIQGFTNFGKLWNAFSPSFNFLRFTFSSVDQVFCIRYIFQYSESLWDLRSYPALDGKNIIFRRIVGNQNKKSSFQASWCSHLCLNWAAVERTTRALKLWGRGFDSRWAFFFYFPFPNFLHYKLMQCSWSVDSKRSSYT